MARSLARLTRDGELPGLELLGKPVNLSSGVTEDNGLGDGDGLVEIRESIEFPLLLLNSNVELLDSFKGQLIPLDENPDGIPHELGGDLEDIGGHGSGEENNLGGRGEELEDIVDLVLESSRKHLIGLIKTEDLDVVGLEGTPLDHVEDTSGGSDNDVDSFLELGHSFTDGGSSNSGEALDVHVVSEGDNDLLNLLGEFTGRGEDESLTLLEGDVDGLENGDGESGGLSSSGLSLGNDIVSLRT